MKIHLFLHRRINMITFSFSLLLNKVVRLVNFSAAAGGI